MKSVSFVVIVSMAISMAACAGGDSTSSSGSSGNIAQKNLKAFSNCNPYKKGMADITQRAVALGGVAEHIKVGNLGRINVDGDFNNEDPNNPLEVITSYNLIKGGQKFEMVASEFVDTNSCTVIGYGENEVRESGPAQENCTIDQVMTNSNRTYTDGDHTTEKYPILTLKSGWRMSYTIRGKKVSAIRSAANKKPAFELYTAWTWNNPESHDMVSYRAVEKESCQVHGIGGTGVEESAYTDSWNY